MKYIKKYSYFKKNESIVETLSMFGILLNLLKIIISFKTDNKNGTKDYTYQNELKKITGYDVEIIKCTDKKNIAYSSSNKIFYNEELLFFLKYDELTAVLLHEFSHINSYDITKRYIVKTFRYIPIIILDSWLLYLISPLISKLLYVGPYIRYTEYTSDSFAKKYGYGEELASALIKIESKYKLENSDYDSNKLYRVVKKIFDVFDTHPKLLDRVKKLYNKNPEDFIENLKKEMK